MKKKLLLILLPTLLLVGCDNKSNGTEKSPIPSPDSQVVEDSATPNSTSLEKTLAEEDYAVKRNFKFDGSVTLETEEKVTFTGKIYDDGFYIETKERGEKISHEFYFKDDDNPYWVSFNKDDGKYYYGPFVTIETLPDFLNLFDFEKTINENTWKYDHSDKVENQTYDYFKGEYIFPLYLFRNITNPVLKFKESKLSSISGTLNNITEDDLSGQIEYNILEVGNQEMGHELPTLIPNAAVKD